MMMVNTRVAMATAFDNVVRDLKVFKEPEEVAI
jgi:hypothetical protein